MRGAGGSGADGRQDGIACGLGPWRRGAAGYCLGMWSGLILLLMIGGAVVFFYTKLRGKLKFMPANKGWQGVLIVTILVLVLLYVTHGTNAGTTHH